MALILGSLARLDGTDILPKLAGIPVQYHYEPHMDAQAAIVKQKLPSAKLVRYDDAGHALFVDDAERFNREVEEMMGQAK
jgi:pimeloyl-ACP methyl ester carboxylesterase